MSGLFDPGDPTELARCVWAGEIAEPEDAGRRGDVDWADGLVEHPRRVLWRAVE